MASLEWAVTQPGAPDARQSWPHRPENLRVSPIHPMVVPAPRIVYSVMGRGGRAVRRRPRAVLIAIVALLVLVVPALVDISTDWLWFGETGYQHVFVKIVTSQAA